MFIFKLRQGNSSVFTRLVDTLNTTPPGLPDEEGQPGIVTLGFTKVEDRVPTESVEFKLKPYRTIHKEAEHIHGISNEEAKKFPSFDKEWPLIKPWLDGQVVVIHNKSFDWPIIEFHIEHYKCEPPSPIEIFWPSVAIYRT